MNNEMTYEVHPFTFSQIQTSSQGYDTSINFYGWKRENDPFWVINNKYFGYFPEQLPSNKMKLLFIGTFPPHSSQSLEFFYGSGRNNFWKIISILTNIQVSSLEDKFNVLKNNGIGITDIIYSLNRKKDIQSQKYNASDENLYPLIFNNINAILNQYPNIKNIIFTSGESSEKSAYGWSINELQKYKREIKLITLRSPSNISRLPNELVNNGDYINLCIKYLDVNIKVSYCVLKWAKKLISSSYFIRNDMQDILNEFEKLFPTI
ncbi:MAG: hypothetical protein HPY53_16315 [Brevinematales bacterium]|nr:hypothetical protein [Brevinematales bacterium]